MNPLIKAFLRHQSLDDPIPIVFYPLIGLFFICFVVMILIGTQLFLRRNEILVMDLNGIRGRAREIPLGNYWDRLRLTPMCSFGCKWEEVVAAKLEILYVVAEQEYVLSLYGDASLTKPIARVDISYFGEPKKIVDAINYYYKSVDIAERNEYVLLRPLNVDIYK